MGVILTVCHWWIVGLWLAFLIYWVVRAFFGRRGLNRHAFSASIRTHVVMLLVILIAIALARRSSYLQEIQDALLWSAPLALSGAVVATLGAVLAFSARAAIGRNWAPPQTRRTDTELITSGPYALVRHPIYSGVLLMMIGTAMGLILTWWLVAAAAAIYFVVSARAEEGFMAERFPDSYPAYRSRTKMLVPFLF